MDESIRDSPMASGLNGATKRSGNKTGERERVEGFVLCFAVMIALFNLYKIHRFLRVFVDPTGCDQLKKNI